MFANSAAAAAGTIAGTTITNPVTQYCANRPGNPSTCVLPAYCTGFEGFVTPAPNSGATSDLSNIGIAASTITTNGAGNNHLATGLRPGNIYAYFCADADGPAGAIPGAQGITPGFNYCGVNNDPYGTTGPLWKYSYNQVLKVFANGNNANLPYDIQDVRFFWQQFVTALLKYFEVVGNNTGPVPDLSTTKLDGYSLFFDSNGAGQFETAEYVDRRFVSATQPPLDVSVTADVKDGIFNDYDFSRELYRGETAVYTVMTANPGDPLGSEDTALVTNMFGNPILAAWPAGTVSSAYTCATTYPQPPDCPAGSIPLDSATGKPMLNSEGDFVFKPYPGAIGTQQTASAGLGVTLAGTTIALGNTGVTIQAPPTNSNGEYSQQAMVSFPVHQNPYDPTSPPGPAISKLLPWTPKQPGNGFSIPVNGELSQFIEAADVDLSGVTISADVFYDCQVDPSTGDCLSNGALQFEAVYSTDFLGDVFLCQDPNTGDLLTAQMYTSVGDMLSWLAAHPGVYLAANTESGSCGLIIRYSPYDNYADYITSNNNGVQVQVTQGGGYGRIVGAVLFVPGQGTGQ